ncbi:hypothetical protein DVH05_000289 [Phytophthora capsici]|nr:hypothetical protein DVH05_000289 [Phytophthora capsici]
MASDLEFLDELTAFLALDSFTSRKSLEGDVNQHLVDREAVTDSLLADSLSNENKKSKRWKSRRRGEIADLRRQKYRERVKLDREELQRTADELSAQFQELINAQKGTKTTARTDLVLSKTFWRKIGIHQREQRLRVEAEHKRLPAIVNAQNMYIESLGVRKESSDVKLDTPNPGNGCVADVRNQIDDLKWLQLKSSVSSLYAMYLQEADKCYAQVDQIFQDIEMESFPVGSPDSSYRYMPNGDVTYFQHRNRFLLPFEFENSSRVLWELVPLPHRQIDREVYHSVSDPANTVALQYRIQQTSAGGKIMSIMKHLVGRRFISNDRVVMVWKIFSEGEGDFSGFDVDEICWARIRPVHDGSQYKTLMEFHSRQVPVPNLSANANNPAVKDFQHMMQDAVAQDEREVARLLGEQLLAEFSLPVQIVCS